MAYFSTHSDPERDHVPQFVASRSEDSPSDPFAAETDAEETDDIFYRQMASEEHERHLDRLRTSAGFANFLLSVLGILLIFLLVFLLQQILRFVSNDLVETFPLLQQTLRGA